MGGQQAPPEAPVLASLGLVSVSDCLIGTSQSGYVSEISDWSLGASKRCSETRETFGMAPSSLSDVGQEYHTEPGCKNNGGQDQGPRLRLGWVIQGSRIK